MISKISKIQTQNTPNSTAIINASLPVIIKVIEKTGYNRYNLKFGSKFLSTKSQRDLEVGGEYFANIGSQSGGVININGLIKRQSHHCLEDGASLVEYLLANGDLDLFAKEIKNRLATAKNSTNFSIYASMILALESGIISVPFLYENRYALIQIKLGDPLELYLLFDNFAPFKALISEGKFIKITTPYKSFSSAFYNIFGCTCEVGNVEPFWQQKENFLDFRG